MMVITQELFRLTDAFARNRVNYAVCGGLAVVIHGRPRLTLDIDFLVPATDLERAITTAASVGFDDHAGWMKLPSNDQGIDRLFRVNKIDNGEFLTLDLLEVNNSENLIFVDRESFELEGHVIQALSRAALIKMKSASDRLKDRLDVELLSDQADES
jgi:hypothetical protein